MTLNGWQLKYQTPCCALEIHDNKMVGVVLPQHYYSSFAIETYMSPAFWPNLGMMPPTKEKCQQQKVKKHFSSMFLETFFKNRKSHYTVKNFLIQFSLPLPPEEKLVHHFYSCYIYLFISIELCPFATCLFNSYYIL